MVNKSSLKALALIAAAQYANAHSWVEALYRISNTGMFVGDMGYPMGWVNRTALGQAFSDDMVLNKILDLKSDPVVCRQFAQGDYSGQAQPLKAAPGDSIAMLYAENGHVTDPELVPGRPYRGGNVYVYGTLKQKPDNKLNDILNVWNAAGTGGNKKGKLLATHFYDDGQCYQDRGAEGPKYPIFVERKNKYGLPELLCQSDVRLPEDLPTTGKYHLFWIWNWPLNNGLAGNTTEIYTSCAEIQLGASDDGSAKTDIKFAADLPVANAAIKSQILNPIEALSLGIGTNSPAAPTGLPTQTTAAPANTTSAGSTVGSTTTSAEHKKAITTVTVTGAPTTVTDFVTVTVTATATATAGGNGAASSPAGTTTKKVSSSTGAATARTSQVAVTNITGFMKVRSTGQARRLAGAEPI